MVKTDKLREFWEPFSAFGSSLSPPTAPLIPLDHQTESPRDRGMYFEPKATPACPKLSQFAVEGGPARFAFGAWIPQDTHPLGGRWGSLGQAVAPGGLC